MERKLGTLHEATRIFLKYDPKATFAGGDRFAYLTKIKLNPHITLEDYDVRVLISLGWSRGANPGTWYLD